MKKILVADVPQMDVRYAAALAALRETVERLLKA
jgi:hypothetical protein